MVNKSVRGGFGLDWTALRGNTERLAAIYVIEVVLETSITFASSFHHLNEFVLSLRLSNLNFSKDMLAFTKYTLDMNEKEGSVQRISRIFGFWVGIR